MTDVPDLAEPIAAWRVWRLVDDGGTPRLVSPVIPTPWAARAATTARCAGTCPRAPTLHCSCGLYALSNPGPIAMDLRFGAGILGCTALWGRVIEAARGWRAEHAYPLALFLRPVIPPPDDRWLTRHRVPGVPRDVASEPGIGRRLAEQYGVPVFAAARRASLRWTPEEVLARADDVRHEALRGLAARRCGDRDATNRLASAAHSFAAAL